MLQHDPNRLLRIQATIALGHIGADAQGAVLALQRAAESDDPNLQAAAADALRKIALQPNLP
jgi:HEAT repeat protein